MQRMIWMAVFVLMLEQGYALTVSKKDSQQIAEKIWKNECGGTIQGLTSWNKGENFASLGIGHFIWYPTNKQERFQETFPALLAYLESQQVILPQWLKEATGCPWNSRDEFYSDIDSPKMVQLRTFLFDTKEWQALFIAQRLEKTLPSMLDALPNEGKQKVKIAFYRLANDPRGLYALIDYLNFKGAGISKEEVYNNQGWGLSQVLQRLDPASKDILSDFVEAAKNTLEQRVQNSPPERGEARWLKGWFNRLDTYKK